MSTLLPVMTAPGTGLPEIHTKHFIKRINLPLTEIPYICRGLSTGLMLMRPETQQHLVTRLIKSVLLFVERAPHQPFYKHTVRWGLQGDECLRWLRLPL